MVRKARPLVKFNANYYIYPNSIRGKNFLLGTSNPASQNFSSDLLRVSFRSDFHKFIDATFSKLVDYEILSSLLRQHGVFAERFFHHNIRPTIIRQFSDSEINLDEFQKLISEAWGYDVKVYSNSDAIFRIIDFLYEQAVNRLLKETITQQYLRIWFDEFSTSKNCVLCGKPFRTVDLPDWIYFGGNGFKYCCFQCPIIQSPKKLELHNLIPEFVKVCGFIPNADAGPINYAFTSRLSELNWAETIGVYAQMGGVEHVKKKFGSWFKGLAETNTLPDGVLNTARGIRCLAQDGHVCHSLDEQRIDDWLTAHHIPHEREPFYPSHPNLNPKSKRRADWKVLDTFIEYFGLIGNQDYEKKMSEKIFLAQEFKINLIAIYPSDITNLDQRLDCLLK